MKKLTALKKAKEGQFEFISDIRRGYNIVRYKTNRGNWKEKVIYID